MSPELAVLIDLNEVCPTLRTIKPRQSEKMLAIIKKALDKARAEEREACARVASEWGECECGMSATLHDIADAIRARREGVE